MHNNMVCLSRKDTFLSFDITSCSSKHLLFAAKILSDKYLSNMTLIIHCNVLHPSNHCASVKGIHEYLDPLKLSQAWAGVTGLVNTHAFISGPTACQGSPILTSTLEVDIQYSERARPRMEYYQ